jgi:hypothetical protein
MCRATGRLSDVYTVRSMRMYQDYSGMYRNVSEQEFEEEECTTREDGNGNGEKFLEINIIVSGINILNVVVALIVELMEELYCIYYIYAVGNNCRRSSNLMETIFNEPLSNVFFMNVVLLYAYVGRPKGDIW